MVLTVLSGDIQFAFVAPMFSASSTLGQMLASLVAQSYTNWKLILIDDVSPNDELIKEKEIVSRFQAIVDPSLAEGKIDVIWNDEKRWETRNVLEGIKLCRDDDIICRLDADDWLTDTDALAMLAGIYGRHEQIDCVWSAHRWGFSDRNISGPLPPTADVYAHPWVTSHLKTFRKRLINGIPYENFTNQDGHLVKRAGDQALYLPVLHNARVKFFLNKVLYHYTIDEQGGAVYQTDDARYQKSEADFIRTRGYVSQGKPWEEAL